MPLADEVLRGDFLAISKAISLVENGAPEAREVLDALASRVGGAVRIGEANAGEGARDSGLAGRVAVAGVFRPGDPSAVTDTMIQAFVWTDVVAAGLLTLGQHIELQWHVPAPSAVQS